MPIYEFSCKACGCSFETLTSIGGEKNVTCVKCGSEDIQKLISSFGIGLIKLSFLLRDIM
jgi:putative FmdB family regulatory protein